jgi:hypothetical protein
MLVPFSPETSKLHSARRLRHVRMASPCLIELSAQCATGLSEKPSRFAQMIRKSACRIMQSIGGPNVRLMRTYIERVKALS